eukprot:3084108-Pleurochrysis_carterae.AAC.1
MLPPRHALPFPVVRRISYRPDRVPASASVTRSAETVASALCFARYRAYSCGTGLAPSGFWRVRSRGSCATENEEQGGARNTALNLPSLNHPSSLDATSALSTSWSAPPSATSMATTLAPRAPSSAGTL